MCCYGSCAAGGVWSQVVVLGCSHHEHLPDVETREALTEPTAKAITSTSHVLNAETGRYAYTGYAPGFTIVGGTALSTPPA